MLSINEKLLDKNLYIVSDLHMGDWTDRDNFKPYRPEFERFLDVVEADENHCLILNGDFLELWQVSAGDIIRNYYDLLERLMELNTIFLVGNHDIDLLGFIGLNMDNKFVNSLASMLLLERNDKRLRICHGHEFDRFNDPKKTLLVGKVASLIAGWIELKLGTTLGETNTETLLDRITMKFVSFFSKIYRYMNRSASESNGKRFYGNLRKYHRKFPDNILITGHTHEAGKISSWFYNSGSWQQKEQHYIIVNRKGDIIIRRWPDQRQILTDLDFKITG